MFFPIIWLYAIVLPSDVLIKLVIYKSVQFKVNNYNKRKYTIVQILPALNTGGVERGVVEISKALVNKNFRSIVISSVYMVSQITRNGGIHYALDVHTKNPLKWPKIRNQLKIILESEKVDLIHFCSRAPAWIGVPLGPILDIPTFPVHMRFRKTNF